MLKDWKSNNLITPADCLRYGRSKHIQDVIQKLEKLHDGVVDAKDYTKIEVTHVRNFIMVILCITNAARASNLMKITIDDVKNARPHEDLNAHVFKSSKYKTSIIYGSKMMVVPNDLYPIILQFVEKLRPIINGSRENRFLFTSSRQSISSRKVCFRYNDNRWLVAPFLLLVLLFNLSFRDIIMYFKDKTISRFCFHFS